MFKLPETIGGEITSLAAQHPDRIVQYLIYEAIVRHCVKVCDERATLWNKLAAMASNNYQTEAEACAKALLAEFGIKER